MAGYFDVDKDNTTWLPWYRQTACFWHVPEGGAERRGQGAVQYSYTHPPVVRYYPVPSPPPSCAAVEKITW